MRFSNGEVVDLYLKSAIEGVIIKWATQINDILTEDSGQAFANGQNPTPSAGTIVYTICWPIDLECLKPIVLPSHSIYFTVQYIIH